MPSAPGVYNGGLPIRGLVSKPSSGIEMLTVDANGNMGRQAIPSAPVLAWGNITGDLSDQSDLNTRLTATDSAIAALVAGLTAVDTAKVAKAGDTMTGQLVASAGISASAVSIDAASALNWSGRTVLRSPTDGNLRLMNNAGNGFNMIEVGGGTASHPGIKRSGTAIAFRLADDSADTSITAANATLSSSTIIGTDSSNRWVISSQDLTGTDLGSPRMRISRANNGQIYLTGSSRIFISNGTTINDVMDVELGRRDANRFAVFANNGFSSRNQANSADAPITASTGTFSGNISAPTFGQNATRRLQSDSDGSFYFDSATNGIRLRFGGNNRVIVGNVTSIINGLNVLASDEINPGPITASTATLSASGGLTTPMVQSATGQELALDGKTTISVRVNGSYQTEIGTGYFRTRGDNQIQWTSGSDYSLPVDAAFARSGTGQVDFRGNNGFRSRNYANSADAPITASTGTFSGKITAPATGQASTGGIGNGFNGIDFFNGIITYLNNAGTPIYPGYFCIEAGVPRLKLGSDCLLGWGNSGDAGSSTAVNTALAQNALGQLDVRGDSGLRLRNLANSANTNLTCAQVIASGQVTVGGWGLAPADSSAGLRFTDGFNVDRMRLISTFATISGGFNQFRLADNLDISWASNIATNSADIRLTRNSTGQLDVRANSGLRLRNFANSGWGSLQCGGITASDAAIVSSNFDTVTTDQAGIDIRNLANRSNTNCGIAFRPGPVAHWAAHIQAFTNSISNQSQGNMLKIRVGKNNNSGTVTPTNLQDVMTIEASGVTITPETASGGLTISGRLTVGSCLLESEEQKTLKSLSFINAVWS